MSDRVAVTVIGTCLVMDYGTKEGAVAAMEALRSEPTPEAAPLGLTVERLARALTSTYNEDVATQDPDDDDRAAARRILAALRDEP